MSDQPQPEPEYLGPTTTGATRGSGPRRRWGAVGAAGLAVVAATGGAWGIGQLMAGGESPATAVPAEAVAYLSIDLDPSAEQKVEGLRTLQKFPALEEKLDLGARDDLRRWVFEQIQKDGGCPELDYAGDVEPWLGDRMAIAAVPAGERVDPLVVVQVTDQDAARDGVEVLGGCAGEDPAVAFVGDFMLLGEKQGAVDAMASGAEESPLADDAGFTTWTERAGDPGIITAYISKELPDVLARGATESEQIRSVYEDFEGGAAVLRFSDGTIEAKTVAEGLPAGVATADAGLPTLGTLPGTTAFALSVVLPEDWLQDYTDTVRVWAGTSVPGADPWETLGRGSGLDLPEDLQTLLGDGFTVAVDSSADLASVIEGTGPPSEVPAGVRITGDPAEITRVLDKLLAQAGPAADMVVVEETADGVTLGVQQSYVEELVTEGDLAESASFDAVLPEADRSSTALFLDFDAGDGWAERLAEQVSGGDRSVVRNVAPLDAVGVSSWVEDDVEHGLVRITTD